MMELITLVVVVVVVVVFSGDHAWMVYYNAIMHSNLRFFFLSGFQFDICPVGFFLVEVKVLFGGRRY